MAPLRIFAAGSLRPAFGRLAAAGPDVAVPEASAAADVSALAEDGARVVIEVDGIPAGVYTRELLATLDALLGGDFAARAMANVVAQEQTVDAVANRLLSGEAEAGVLYATDVLARRGELRAIEPPAAAAVGATYAACVVTATDQPERAAAWLDALSVAPASAILRDAGVGPPPDSAAAS